MKKIVALCILMFFVCNLVSCDTSIYTKSGIENFSIFDSSYGVNRYLIPQDFLDLFDYCDGGYDYYEGGGGYIYVTTLLYMEYDETTYLDAKEYALNHLKLVEESEEQYKGYIFFKRDETFYNLKGEEEHTQRFYFAYSDEQRILLAVGSYMSGPYKYQSSYLTDYLDTYFSFYNFEEGKIEREIETEETESTKNTGEGSILPTQTTNDSETENTSDDSPCPPQNPDESETT